MFFDANKSSWQSCLSLFDKPPNTVLEGTFVAIFFMTLHPGVFTEELYMVGVIALVLGYVASTMFMLKVIFMNFLETDKKSLMSLSVTLAL